MSDIFDRYIADFPESATQEEIKAFDKAFNLREGVGCPACGGGWEGNYVTDGAKYYQRCSDCGELREKTF